MDHRIGLGETLETLDELGQVGGISGLDGHAHYRAHTELHDAQVVRVLERADRARLDEELIDTDETANVTARHVLDGLRVSAHHENGALDGLHAQIVLLARHVVGSHEASLLAGGHCAREDATKGVEAALVRRRHHLRDVHHEWRVRVACLHAFSFVITID